MPPARFGRYEVRRVLGRGGMGVVYAGQDPQIDRPVAIKTIALEGFSATEAAEFEARFRAEMRSTGRLLHQNIVALYDAGRDDGTAYIVMELVPGQDLKRRLADGQRFSLQQAVDVTLQLLAALGYAHAREVVHRDVKPANVMLQDDGQVKLCDFGVARLTDADATLTRGGVVGTLRYAAPEQLAGQPVDRRTDLYAAAALLYELLTGQPPVDGRSELELLQHIAQQAPLPPSQRVPTLPAAIDAVLLRALSKDPAQRYDSAAEFAAALRAAVAGAETPAGRAGSGGTSAPLLLQPPRSRRAWGWGLATLLALLLGGAWLARQREEPTPAQVAATRPAAAPLTPAIETASAPPAAAVPAPVPTAQALQTPAPPAVAAARAPVPSPVALRLDGPWIGLYACGATLGKPANPKGYHEPFSSKLALEIKGTRISWTRSGKSYRETSAGSIDARGRFTATGQGRETLPSGGSSEWTLRAKGRYNPRSQPPRLEGEIELFRSGDGTLARQCTLSAVPR
jgi:hypothetical protein